MLNFTKNEFLFLYFIFSLKIRLDRRKQLYRQTNLVDHFSLDYRKTQLFRCISIIKLDDVFATETGSTKSTGDEAVSLGDSQPEDNNLLLLTGIGLCVLVLLCSVAFVCYRQWKARQMARKLILTSTPVHEALLSSSAEQADKSRGRIRQQSSTAAHDSNDHSQKQVS